MVERRRVTRVFLVRIGPGQPALCEDIDRRLTKLCGKRLLDLRWYSDRTRRSPGSNPGVRAPSLGYTVSYFKTSYATLQQLAKAGRYEDVAGFLVMARHATGLPIGDFEPYKLSGAGINSIHEKAGVGEETARGVMQRLQEYGVVQPATAEAKRAFGHARWEIVQGELDLALPHAFTDPLKAAEAGSILKRVRAAIVRPQYAQVLKGLSDTELRLDMLMVMLGIYRNTNMEAFGGLWPQCVLRNWSLKSQATKSPGIRWGAEPKENGDLTAFTRFMTECLPYLPKDQKGRIDESLQSHRFWNAWYNISESGLVYEAVTLYDTSPLSNNKARLQFTIRVNDFHAGAAHKSGDPSYLRYVGTDLGYYTPAENDRGEPEAMWVILPDKRGDLVGVWRPRFRASTPDVGAWVDQENAAIEAALGRLVANKQAQAAE